MTPAEGGVDVITPQEPRGAAGRYEILRVVNRGGMGEIALGRVRGTRGFEKLVVLKRLRADAERDDHIAMFDVEQEVMSRIEHPNIVKVFDQPVIDRVPYLAMEYVRGRNLDQIIRQVKGAGEDIPLDLVLSVISEVLRGLAFVHRLKDGDGKALGVVHQDMTPSNVMVSFFGEVKITDFGISYVTSRDGGLRQGVLKGKPRYVAPEVLAGKRVNNRADIYGVGVVLYELLTGRALFARTTVKDTLSAVARNELPDFNVDIPRLTDGLNKILLRALAKDPQDRYRTAEEMGANVLNELAKLGGAISAARLGYIIRQRFQSDPDVPEMDAALEAALSSEANPVAPSSLRSPDLEQTLSELDRLLGPGNSVDLFTLPPEIKTELAALTDMDPFLALTPAPDFVWDAPNEAELLRRASETYGPELGQVTEPRTVPDLELSPAELPPELAILKPSGPASPPAPRPRAESTTAPRAAPLGVRTAPPSVSGAYSEILSDPGKNSRAPKPMSLAAASEAEARPQQVTEPATPSSSLSFRRGLIVGLLTGLLLGASVALLVMARL